MGRDQMRAADADRERVAERLRAALEEGRLDLHEFDERLQGAYAAKTYGDLDALLTDLPVMAPTLPVVATAKGSNATGEWLVHVWQGLVPTALILTAVWAISGLGYYWPAWVVGPWALILVWQTISGLVSGAPRRMVEERAAKALEHEERKQKRKAFEDERIARAIPSAKEKSDPSAWEKHKDPSAWEKKGDMSGLSGDDTPDHG